MSQYFVYFKFTKSSFQSSRNTSFSLSLFLILENIKNVSCEERFQGYCRCFSLTDGFFPIKKTCSQFT